MGRDARVETPGFATLVTEPERVAASCTAAFAATAVAGALTGAAAAGGAVVSGAGAESPDSPGVAAGASAPPSDPVSVAGAGSVEVGVVASVVVPSVEAWTLTAESSSDARTWSPAAAENAAPATKRAEKVKATTVRRRRERGFVLAGPGTGAATSSSPPFSSHSSQARPWHSLLINEFRGGIAYRSVFRAPRPPLRRGFQLRDPRAVRTDLTIDKEHVLHSPEVGRYATNHQTEGYAVGKTVTMIRCN